MNTLLEEIKNQPKGLSATELINLIMKIEKCHITQAYSIRKGLIQSGEIIQVENLNPKTHELRVPWESMQKVWYLPNNLHHLKNFMVSILEGTWKVRRFYKINTDIPIKVINKIIPDENRKITEEDLDKINDSVKIIADPFIKLKKLLES